MARKRCRRLIELYREAVLAGLIVSLLLSSAAQELGSETLVMTATYPSPVGIYARLITTGGSPATPLDTIFSRAAGAVVIGANGPYAGAKFDVEGSGFVLLNSGNVGIGTASPAYKLDVNGSANVNGSFGWVGALRSGLVPWYGAPRVGLTGFPAPCSNKGEPVGSAFMRGLDPNGNPICDAPLGYSISINGMTGTNFTIAGGTGISISNSGSPGNTITINSVPAPGSLTGSGSANYVAKWATSSSLGTGAIYDNGNVGIGTTSPGQKLEVNGNVKVGGFLVVDTRFGGGPYYPAVGTDGTNTGVSYAVPGKGSSGYSGFYILDSTGVEGYAYAQDYWIQAANGGAGQWASTLGGAGGGGGGVLPTADCYMIYGGRWSAIGCRKGFYLKAITQTHDNNWDGNGGVCCNSNATAVGTSYNTLAAQCSANPGSWGDHFAPSTCPPAE